MQNLRMANNLQNQQEAGSIYNGNSSLDYFTSQMERSHRIVDTTQVKFNGSTLKFDYII